jgi:hypothetical protein
MRVASANGTMINGDVLLVAFRTRRVVHGVIKLDMPLCIIALGGLRTTYANFAKFARRLIGRMTTLILTSVSLMIWLIKASVIASIPHTTSRHVIHVINNSITHIQAEPPNRVRLKGANDQREPVAGALCTTNIGGERVILLRGILSHVRRDS